VVAIVTDVGRDVRGRCEHGALMIDRSKCLWHHLRARCTDDSISPRKTGGRAATPSVPAVMRRAWMPNLLGRSAFGQGAHVVEDFGEQFDRQPISWRSTGAQDQADRRLIRSLARTPKATPPRTAHQWGVADEGSRWARRSPSSQGDRVRVRGGAARPPRPDPRVGGQTRAQSSAVLGPAAALSRTLNTRT